MTFKYKNKRTGIIKIVLFVLLISILIVPVWTLGFETHRNFNKIDYNSVKNDPEIQGFSKEVYKPLLTEEKQGLGTINVTNIDFNEKGFDNYSTLYPGIDEDLSSKALNITFEKIRFVRTIRAAQVDNINADIEDFNKTTVLLNETISVQYQYNESKPHNGLEGYLIYGPRLYPCLLDQLFVKNGSSPAVKVGEGNYSIDENNFLVFNYDIYFNDAKFANFTMNLFWEYNMTINNWDLTQIEESLILTEIEQNVSGTFEYFFNLEGDEFNGENLQDKIPAENLTVYLKVALPDMEFLNNFTLKIDDQTQSLKLHLLSDNAFHVTLLSGNNSLFYLNFTADFTVKFVDPVGTTWAIDRLVDNRNIRERVYFPSIISGPEHIYVKYLAIDETTITIDQVERASSLFERGISYFDKNLTEFEGTVENSLVFTENVVKKRGLEVKLPFMIKGETCPFSITYETVENLRVIITDDINMPISGLQVEIIYYGKEYGTYISNNKTQPFAPLITDENGEIFLTNVSNGNYMVLIHQEQNVTMVPVSAYREVNYVATTIPHFPLWLLIYGSINASIFLIGVYFHLKIKSKV